MALQTALHVRLKGIQGTEFCYNNLWYFHPDNLTALTGAAAAAAVYDQIVTPMLVRLHQDFTMLEITVRANNYTSVIVPEYTRVVNEVGGYTVGQVLPPNVTVALMKVPDNSTVDPVDGREFGIGRMSISGIPEDYQNNGILENTAYGDFSGFALGLLSIDILVGGVNQEFVLGMQGERVPGVPGPGNDKVQVTQMYPRQYVGTQNTRKR